MFPPILYCKRKVKRSFGERMKEISTAISYQEDKHTRSAMFTTSGSGNYCVLKWENTQYKVENGIQSNTDFFFCPRIPSS